MVKKPSPAPHTIPPSVAEPPGPRASIAGTAGIGATVFPIVGLGPSAGGLAAFEAFFSGMPADRDPGMAFVLVQHLAPDHKSILTDLVRRYTRMQVFEVEDGMVVQPDCAYIIPPNCNMAFLNGALQLLEPIAPRGQRLPIDFFFSSLAADQREHAIGIVLSGTGSDGTLGVRAIKDAGGMVMVQNTASSEFDGTPRSAINAGLVDYELPLVEMPAQLIAYATQAFGKLPRSKALSTPKTENALKRIFVLLRALTGHDFSQYKPSTIHRRIERRMAVHQVETMDGYIRFLQQTPSEVEALFRDVLIGVTNFFRDPAPFQVLEDRVIPKLFAGKAAGGEVRVWCSGCSSGEEAYSIAILLVERMEALKQNYTLQVFATDIDSRAIATARTGMYPASIATDISPERLARFFVLQADGLNYRIGRSLRDLLVFSEQDVIKDPPFSRLDLIHDVEFPINANVFQEGNEFYRPEDWPIVRAAMQAAIEYGTAYDLESPFVAAKGRHIWVRVQGFAVRKNGKTTRLRAHHESLEPIRLALSAQEFVLYYQPKVNMRTGEIIGAEALIRWQHPEKGLLAPSVFLPAIEDDPLAVAVGEWVIDTALTQIGLWHAAGVVIPVSVNIGARQLQQADFVDRLLAILATHPRTSPSCLELEVLETSALADVAQVSRMIWLFRKG